MSILSEYRQSYSFGRSTLQGGTVSTEAIQASEDPDIHVRSAGFDGATIVNSGGAGDYIGFNQLVRDRYNFWADALPEANPAFKSGLRVDNKYGTLPNGTYYDYRDGVWEFGGSMLIAESSIGSRRLAIVAEVFHKDTNTALYETPVWTKTFLAEDGQMTLDVLQRNFALSQNVILAAINQQTGLPIDKMKTFMRMKVFQDSGNELEYGRANFWFRRTGDIRVGAAVNAVT